MRGAFNDLLMVTGLWRVFSVIPLPRFLCACGECDRRRADRRAS